MAAEEKNEIERHLKIALKEIGEIKPWFSKEFKAWVYYHDLYPVEYSGDSEEEVIQNYPLYLKEFIKHRLQDQLAPLMEKKTAGHGGKRMGAGRPKKSAEEQKVRVYLPRDIATWIKYPGMIQSIRQLVSAYKN
ncbi:MAG: hypothetical protein ACK5MA_04585 [Parachlamydiaceae bacterium]